MQASIWLKANDSLSQVCLAGSHFLCLCKKLCQTVNCPHPWHVYVGKVTERHVNCLVWIKAIRTFKSQADHNPVTQQWKYLKVLPTFFKWGAVIVLIHGQWYFNKREDWKYLQLAVVRGCLRAAGTHPSYIYPNKLPVFKIILWYSGWPAQNIPCPYC